MIETANTEHLLAAWREAERQLNEADSFHPGRSELEARVHEARLTYLARVDEVQETIGELFAYPAP